jgi:hypothetical protein
MSDADLTTDPGEGASSVGDAGADPFGPVRALSVENVAQARRLRAALIPQHVGMAAACRALAAEIPRALMGQIDADLASGALAQRWEAVRAAAAEPGASGELDPTLFALALLLREQRRDVVRHLARRQKEWTADAYRLEGQAGALDATAARLLRVAGGATESDPAGADSDAQVICASKDDGGSPNGRGLIER